MTSGYARWLCWMVMPEVSDEKKCQKMTLFTQ